MKVYVACSFVDEWRARICALGASQFFPKEQICMLVNGADTSISRFCNHHGIQIRVFDDRDYGWGYLKLEPLFDAHKHKFLMLDADTLILRDISALFENRAEFVVDDEELHERFDELYFPRSLVKEALPETNVEMSFSWNTGQWFGTSGVLHRRDFDRVVHWRDDQVQSASPFLQGEMGPLNHVIHNAMVAGKTSVVRRPLMYYPTPINKQMLDTRYVIHWAGMKKSDWLLQLPHGHLLMAIKGANRIAILYYILRHWLRQKWIRILRKLK